MDVAVTVDDDHDDARDHDDDNDPGNPGSADKPASREVPYWTPERVAALTARVEALRARFEEARQQLPFERRSPPSRAPRRAAGGLRRRGSGQRLWARDAVDARTGQLIGLLGAGLAHTGALHRRVELAQQVGGVRRPGVQLRRLAVDASPEVIARGL
jgi:hypothetical protein